MGYVDAIERGEPPANPSRIVRASVGADNVPPMTAAELKAALPPVPARPTPLPGIPAVMPPQSPALRVDLFDFELPPERIALRPARPRDPWRMLVVEPARAAARPVGAR